jgi:hypothetical protein
MGESEGKAESRKLKAESWKEKAGSGERSAMSDEGKAGLSYSWFLVLCSLFQLFAFGISIFACQLVSFSAKRPPSALSR